MPLKHYILTTITLILTLTLQAQEPTVEWTITHGQEDASEEIYGVKIDSEGNVFILGRYIDTMDADPTEGEHILDNPDGNAQVYLQKLDSDGKLLWIRKITKHSASRFIHDEIRFFLSSKNEPIIVGEATYPQDLDPTEGESLTEGENAKQDIYYVKYAPDGTIMEGKVIIKNINKDLIYLRDATIDENDNIYLTGYFIDLADFAPNTPEGHKVNTNRSIQFGEERGIRSAYILKVNQSGDFVWVKTYVDDDYSEGRIIAYGNGHIIVHGAYDSTLDVGDTKNPIVLPGSSPNLAPDRFTVKLNTNGDVIWGHGNNSPFYDIIIDSNDNIITIDHSGYEQKINITPEPKITITPEVEGNDWVFVTKYNSSGEYLWHKTISGENGYQGVTNQLILDQQNNLYFSVVFKGTVNLDSIIHTTQDDLYDSYICKMNTEGEIQWTQVVESHKTKRYHIQSIVDFYSIDVFEDTIYWGGKYRGEIDIDLSKGTEQIISANPIETSTNAILIKFTQPYLNTNGFNLNQDSTVYIVPNPSNGNSRIFLEETSDTKLKVVSLDGQVVYSNNYSNTNTIDLTLNLPAAMYIIQLSNKNGLKSLKWVVE